MQPTIGVEEEFFVIDRATRAMATTEHLMTELSAGPASPFDHEFQEPIVESRTGICFDLKQVRSELQGLRRSLLAAAAAVQVSVVSAGTLPQADWRAVRTTSKPLYQQISDLYGEIVHRRLTCGCHIHIGVSDRELAVQVLNRVRPWLPVLLALSASSPFYEGVDTGYCSFRNVLWGAFPVAGIPDAHSSYRQYLETISSLIDTHSLVDAGQVYWDARLSVRYPTVEFRVADACTTVGETVLLAGLCRALVLTCQWEAIAGRPAPDIRPEMLRAASWRAARSGLDADLIDVTAGQLVPASDLLDRLLRHTQDALEELGDWEQVGGLVDDARRGNTSAGRQRAVLARTGRMSDVVDMLAADTAPSDS